MRSAHPYAGKPTYQFWKHEPGIRAPELFDPVTRPSFRIERDDAVVTAGSCFAQHVARYLAHSGFRFLVTEHAHPIVHPAVAREFHYGLFSARYGNVYTARQLKQLLQRAYGEFTPAESAWQGPRGETLDPFRPQIQPGGFLSAEELAIDRARHFRAVRDAVESMSVFVFTLGLTEAWTDVTDGAVFPLAPGVAGGRFDPQRYVFRNFSVEEVHADMKWSMDFLRARNPGVRFLLTVSPVPLNATAEDRHVFVSTVYSKAVLRIAADMLAREYDGCDYFPSYEIITSPHVRGRYYAEDCRDVTDEGVRHVMGLFLRHYGGVDELPGAAAESVEAGDATREHLKKMEHVVEVLCDEDRISGD